MQLAQVNVGRIRAAMDSEVMREFRENLDPVNALAEASPGFVWRLQSDSGNATDIVFSEDPMELVNLSVWESVEALRAYVYQPAHVDFLKRRGEWFERAARPGYALWWVPDGHVPSVEEARERLAHYQAHGATPYAFWFSQVYGPGE